MKKFLIFLITIFTFVNIAHANTETLQWYVDGNVYATTTCESGDNITPPSAPSKTGYHFAEWLEYQPIEYLESTGTQWIDTGIKPNQNIRVMIKFKCDVQRNWIKTPQNLTTSSISANLNRISSYLRPKLS